MIPTIGVMIAAYIVLRCFEMMLRSEDYWNSNGGRLFVVLLAACVIGTTVLSVVDLAASSQRLENTYNTLGIPLR